MPEENVKPKNGSYPVNSISDHKFRGRRNNSPTQLYPHTQEIFPMSEYDCSHLFPRAGVDINARDKAKVDP
jgi:hypothetical protein